MVELLCLLRSRLEAVPTMGSILWTEEFDEELDFTSVKMDEDDIALGALVGPFTGAPPLFWVGAIL